MSEADVELFNQLLAAQEEIGEWVEEQAANAMDGASSSAPWPTRGGLRGGLGRRWPPPARFLFGTFLPLAKLDLVQLRSNGRVLLLHRRQANAAPRQQLQVAGRRPVAVDH